MEKPEQNQALNEKPWPRWFEKSVEYQFVRSVLPPSAVTAPLAGPSEQLLGDLIEADHGAFRLIEFKRDHEALGTERGKYSCLKALARDVYFADGIRQKAPGIFEMKGAAAHWLVYGEEDVSRGPQVHAPTLRLLAKLYGSARNAPARELRVDEDMTRVPGQELLLYIVKLMTLRGKDSIWSSGGLVTATTEHQTIVMAPWDFAVLAMRQRRHRQRPLEPEPPMRPAHSLQRARERAR